MSEAVREERRVITALFADLVGSTALAERLDPEEVRLVVGDAVARIVGVVEDLGGHVKDLAGDGVLAFFGAPTAAEDDAERAARAALRIVEEIGVYGEEVARAWGVEGLAVRLGIASGPVVVGLLGAGGRVEYAAFGDTVNLAARLQTAARPGTVLLDDATRRLVSPLFAWGERRELELKGKSGPVGAVELGAPLDGARAQRGLEGMHAELIGRTAELARGRTALDAVLTGAGGVLFVTGEAGIGKTRLLAELHDAFARGSSAGGTPLWLEGRCVSYGESLPYAPFRELIREWLGVGRDAPELRVRLGLRRGLERLFGPQAPELYPYLASLLDLTLERDQEDRIAGLSPEALQYRTFEVVETLVERLAESGPLALVLEDLHWADQTSLQLVERLLALPERAAVLLLLTQRNEPDHPSWALRERAEREYPHLTLELALQPLSGDAQGELLASLVGPGTLPPELEWRLLDQAEGNPFYLEELIRSLVDSGALVRDDGGWRFDHDVAVSVPPTVEKVILARLDRLSPECREVATAASALGRRFALPLLEGVLDRSGGAVDALHELQRLDLVRPARRWPQPEYRFKHALIQEATYGTLLGPQRTELHRRAAVWLEEHHSAAEHEVLGELAHHWLLAAGRGQGRRVPRPRRRPRAPRARPRRGDRALPAAAAAARPPRRATADGGRSLQARARAAHDAAVRGGRTRSTSRRSASGSARRRGRPRRPRRCASAPTSCRELDPVAPMRRPTCSSRWRSTTGSSSAGRSRPSCRRSRSGGRSIRTGCATASSSAKGSNGRTARR